MPGGNGVGSRRSMEGVLYRENFSYIDIDHVHNGYLLKVSELQDKPLFKGFYQFLAAGLNCCRICPNTFKTRYFSKPAAVIKLFESCIFNDVTPSLGRIYKYIFFKYIICGEKESNAVLVQR